MNLEQRVQTEREYHQYYQRIEREMAGYRPAFLRQPLRVIESYRLEFDNGAGWQGLGAWDANVHSAVCRFDDAGTSNLFLRLRVVVSDGRILATRTHPDARDEARDVQRK